MTTEEATYSQNVVTVRLDEDEVIVLGEALAAMPEEHIAALEASREEKDGMVIGITIEPVTEIIKGLSNMLARCMDFSMAINEIDKDRPLITGKEKK